MKSFVSWRRQEKKLSSVLIAILVFQTIFVMSQLEPGYAQTFAWERILNHEGPKQNATDFSFGVAAGSDGVYIVGRSHFDDGYYYAESADSFLAKYDFSGNLVFDYILPVSYQYDGADRVIVDGKNVFITGSLADDYPDYLIVFNESTSEVSYPITWGGTEYDWEEINSIATYNHELYVVILYQHLRRNPQPWPLDYIIDWWNKLRIIKFASNLTKIWEKTVNFFPHTSNGGAIAVDSSGIYLAGEFEHPFSGQSGSGNYSLVKLDFNGDFLWKVKYRDKINYTLISGMALNNGYIYITGGTGLPPYPGGWPTNYDYFIAKYDTSGNLIWDKVFKTSDGSLPAFHGPVHIAIGTNGIYLAGGITKSIVFPGNDDVLIVKLDFAGNLLWSEAEWGGPKNDYIEGMTAFGDDAYITGFTWSYTDGSGNPNAFLLRFGEPLSITAPNDITVEGNTIGGATAVPLGTATVSGGTEPYTITNDAPTLFPLGTTTVTWTVTDDHGATAIDTQSVIVDDTTPPTITITGVIDLGVYAQGVTVTYSADDIVWGVVACSGTSNGNPITSPWIPEAGVYALEVTATDGSGNTATETLMFVVYDTEAYIEYVNETMQDLPDNIFSRPEEDVPDVKNDFSDLFNDILENIDEENYEGALEKLSRIKEKIYEEIVESAERQELVSMINVYIAYLETLL